MHEYSTALINSNHLCCVGAPMQVYRSAHIWCCLLDVASQDVQASPSPSSSASRHYCVDSEHATREFIDFLKTLKSGREIFKQCRAFTESMVYKRVSGNGFVLLFVCLHVKRAQQLKSNLVEHYNIKNGILSTRLTFVWAVTANYYC